MYVVQKQTQRKPYISKSVSALRFLKRDNFSVYHIFIMIVHVYIYIKEGSGTTLALILKKYYIG